MLLPGADIALCIVVLFVALVVVVVVGLIGAMATFSIVPKLIRKTPQAKRYWSGQKNADRWYLHGEVWFRIGFVGWAAFTLYIVSGPAYHLCNKLLGG